MRDVKNKILTAVIEKQEITLTVEESKELVNLLELLERQLRDYKDAFDPNSYEEFGEDEELETEDIDSE